MIDLDNIGNILVRAPAGDLARIIGQSVQYNRVIRKVALLHAAFLEAPDDEALLQAARDAATIDEHVPYTEADAYCQVLDELAILIQRLADQGRKDLARQIVIMAVEVGEASAEQIMDGDFWQMSVDDLRKLAGRLGVPEMEDQ